jgi:hypothetical protein
MDQERRIALPQLYGAPAYARPPVVPAAPAPRPVSPDDLPIAAEMTPEDLDLLAMATAVDIRVAEAPGEVVPVGEAAPDATPSAAPDLARPFSMRNITDRIRGLRP